MSVRPDVVRWEFSPQNREQLASDGNQLPKYFVVSKVIGETQNSVSKGFCVLIGRR